MTCRERAAGTIQCLVVKELGARDLIQHGGVQALVRCLTDLHDAVKEAAYKALVEAARFDCTRQALAQHGGALSLLLSLVQQEAPVLQALGLQLLVSCCQVRLQSLRTAGSGVFRCVGMLPHSTLHVHSGLIVSPVTWLLRWHMLCFLCYYNFPP